MNQIKTGDRVTITIESAKEVEWSVTEDQIDERSVAMVLSYYYDTVALLPPQPTSSLTISH